jgi:hypothetical protein
MRVSMKSDVVNSTAFFARASLSTVAGELEFASKYRSMEKVF